MWNMAEKEANNIVNIPLKNPNRNSDNLSDNIQELYGKEQTFCKQRFGYELANPGDISLINELYSKAKELTEKIEKKIEDVGNGEWFNLYQALGTKEVYSSLADFSFDQFFRTNLIQSLLPNDKNTSQSLDNKITSKSSDAEKNKVIEGAMKTIKGILKDIDKIGKAKDIDVENMEWNNQKDFKQQMIKFFKSEFPKAEDMLEEYKLCHKVLLGEDGSWENKIKQKFDNNIKKGLIIFYGQKKNRLVPIVVLNIDDSNVESTENKKGFKQFKQKEFGDANKFLEEFVNMIYGALPKNKEYPDGANFITFLKEIAPGGESLLKNEALSAVERLYNQYNNQGVSGILGEIRGAIFFNKGLQGKTKIIGSETAPSGQRAVDVQLEVKNDEQFKNGVGLQVKNYVYSNSKLQLYSTDLTLWSSKSLGRYLDDDYVGLLIKFLNNYEFSEYYEFLTNISESLMKQLCFNIDSFLRIRQRDAVGENLFFLVNSLYYPSSYVLRLLQLAIESEKKKTIDSFFNINDSNNLLYFKGPKTIRNQYLLKSKNILSDNRISFEGLTIPISSLTRGETNGKK